MTPDREAAAGLVERLESLAGLMDEEIYLGGAAAATREAATLITTLLSELERVGKERDEALDRAHYAAGTAELAMKHRDAAEALVAEGVRVCEPLANEAAFYDPPEGDDSQVAFLSDFTIGHLRAARAFIDRAKES